jgi:hypothetical protein
MTPTEAIKELASDPKAHIRLFDAVAGQVRAACERLSQDGFLPNSGYTIDELNRRLVACTEAIAPLQETHIVVARWANIKEHLSTLRMAVTRLSELNYSESGLNVWIALKWYPITRLLYAAGIAALDGDNYMSLAALLMPLMRRDSSGMPRQEIVRKAISGFREGSLDERFRQLPGLDRHRTPISDHFFEALRPELERVLYMGNSFEEKFDRFEIFYSLIYADLQRRQGGNAWGPIGRFGWNNRDITNELVQEVEALADQWPPLKAGLFSGSPVEFKSTVEQFKKGALAHLHW